MKLIHISMSITEKKIQVDKNGCECILFRIDIYFFEYFLPVEIDEEDRTDRDFRGKKIRGSRKKSLVLNLLELIQARKVMMQTMKLVGRKHLLVNLKIYN